MIPRRAPFSLVLGRVVLSARSECVLGNIETQALPAATSKELARSTVEINVEEIMAEWISRGVLLRVDSGHDRKVRLLWTRFTNQVYCAWWA